MLSDKDHRGHIEKKQPDFPDNPVLPIENRDENPSGSFLPGKKLPGIHGITGPELASWMVKHGYPSYRARQVFDAMFRTETGTGNGFELMSNIPKALRMNLAESFSMNTLQTIDRQLSSDGTMKLLHQCADGLKIESVLIPQNRRRTVCLSSQAGCRWRCKFCESGRKGLERNLEAGEIIEQAAAYRQHGPITNAVFMGSGEPMENLDAVLHAAAVLNDPRRLAMAARHITVSTCGIPDGIRRFARCKRQYRLSVSLHAANNDLRNWLCPVNRKWPLESLLKACNEYIDRSGRMITFEYILIDGLNVSDKDARDLGHMLGRMNCKLNLIPVNPAGGDFFAPGAETLRSFISVLTAQGLKCTVRAEHGRDIDAACGQLKGRHEKNTVD